MTYVSSAVLWYALILFNLFLNQSRLRSGFMQHSVKFEFFRNESMEFKSKDIGGILRIEMPNFETTYTAQQFEAQIKSWLVSASNAHILDFKNCIQYDPRVLLVLAHYGKQLKNNDKQLFFMNVSEVLKAFFKENGLSSIYINVATVDECRSVMSTFEMFSAEILIVDSLITSRKNLETHLRNLGFSQIASVGDIKQAWDYLLSNQSSVRLVISEIKMPKMSGVDLLKLVRSQAEMAKIAFILVHQQQDEVLVKSLYPLGLDGGLMKPIHVERLSRHIIESIVACEKRILAA